MAENWDKEIDDLLHQIDFLMDDIIDEVFALSQNNLLEQNKIDTGFLLKTANVERAFLDKTIVYPAIYAEPVHFGRQKGTMLPPKALEKWVRRKLKVKDPKEVQAVAFKIALAIKKRGIKAVPFLSDAAFAIEKKYESA